MDEVLINLEYQGDWLKKYFPSQTYASIAELIGCIEELDSKIFELEHPYNPEEDFMYTSKIRKEEGYDREG